MMLYDFVATRGELPTWLPVGNLTEQISGNEKQPPAHPPTHEHVKSHALYDILKSHEVNQNIYDHSRVIRIAPEHHLNSHASILVTLNFRHYPSHI